MPVTMIDEPKIPASEVSYDNRGTTLISDNVQTAITELTNDVDDRCIWSNAVSCAVGDTSCTITDDNITPSSIVDVYNQNASGTPININTVTRSIGQVGLAFNKPLTEATEFKLRIINRLGGGGGKRLDPDEITVTSSDHLIDGYIDYDHNGDLIIGTNLGFDAGVTQGHADRDAGVTITDPSHLIKGYKARNSSGDLLIGSDLGYIAGVMQGHADRDTGVSLTSASQLISGYSARTSSGDLVTGTDAGYNAGVTQGENNMKSGVTVLTAAHIINGYKARNSSGTLLTGTDKGYSAGVNQGHADRDTGVTVSDSSHIINGYKARTSNGTLLTGTASTRPSYSESNPRVNLTVTERIGNIKWVGCWSPTQKIMLEPQDTHCKVTGHTNASGDSVFGIYVDGSLVTNLDGNGNGEGTFSNKSYVEIKSANGINYTSGDIRMTYSIMIW